MMPTIQLLVEDAIYIYQDEMLISGGDSAYQWTCEDPSNNSRSDQLVGILVWTQKSFS